jgi:signal transduction histidine kinase
LTHRNNALTQAHAQISEALDQQTATSEILRVISESPTDTQPVFETIVGSAYKLCDAVSANLFTFDGKAIHVAALKTSEEFAGLARKSFPRPAGPDTAAGRAVVTRSVVAIADVLADVDYHRGFAALSIGGGFRSILAVPLMKEADPIGALAVGRPDPGPFSDAQVALLKTFADQAVIAIENARLFNETKEALEQQTATSEILRVISRSPTDVQPVFDTIAAAALKLCGATSATVVRFDGQLVDIVAHASGLKPEEVVAIRRVYPRPPSRDTSASRAILTRSVVNIPDVLEDPEYAIRDVARSAGYRSTVGVPLMLHGRPIGAFGVARPEVGLFPHKQVALLETFADQAVIAIENVRLVNETREALEQQTATSDILRVISQSPRDVQPVFDAIVRSAARLFGRRAALRTVEADGLRRRAASYVAPDEYHGPDLMPIDGDSIVGRAVLERRSQQVVDTQASEAPRFARAASGRLAYRSIASAPLVREGQAIGVISVSSPEPGALSDKQIGLLQTFADQAVIAIENVRLFTELEARTRDLTRSVGELKALGEVGQAVSSTLDLETVLSTIVARAAQLAGMDGGSIWEYDELREEFHLRATDRLPEKLVEALRTAPIRKGEGALGRLAMISEPVQIRDIGDERTYQSRLRQVTIRSGFRSVLAVPLLRENHLLGALAVNRTSTGDFAPEIIELLKAFATQSALAIQNARLYREIEVKSRQLEAASRHKSEFLANMSHELRTPLNAIIGFSEVLSERMFGEINEKQAEYIGDILESGQHLLSLINDILDLSKIEAGRMELEPTEFDLPSVIENTLILVRERAQRHGITLGRAVDERLRIIRGDERKVKQVLLNLLSNALKFTPEGGEIEVRAQMRDGAAEISVRDTGVGIAPEDQEAVFEEFRQVGTASKKVEGTGLGLAISRKFIELHGGRIWVKSKLGTGSTFTFTLPLR